MDLFVKRLNDLIEDGGISRKQLAEQIGVSPRQITRWTSGEAEPGAMKIKAICEVYGVSADYILDLPKRLDWPE